MREIQLTWQAVILMSLQSEARSLLEWRLIDHSEGPLFRRWASRIDALGANGRIGQEWVPTIKSVLLVETRERPPSVRLVEWILGTLPVERARCITKGPFQMREAPFSFADAVVEVQSRLSSALGQPPRTQHELERLGLMWNGSSQRESGSAVSYPEALALAHRIILRWPTTADLDPRLQRE